MCRRVFHDVRSSVCWFALLSSSITSEEEFLDGDSPPRARTPALSSRVRDGSRTPADDSKSAGHCRTVGTTFQLLPRRTVGGAPCLTWHALHKRYWVVSRSSFRTGRSSNTQGAQDSRVAGGADREVGQSSRGHSGFPGRRSCTS